MKKIFMFMTTLMVSTILFAQNYKQWEDSYGKPGAPGYEELQKAFSYKALGDMKNYYSLLYSATEKDNLYARFLYSLHLMEGIKNVLNCDTLLAIQNMAYIADKGYAPAQHALSYYFYDGIGIPQNNDLGIKYLKLSAEQGYLPAKKYLANCLLIGKEGIPRDTEKGLKMTEECAIIGDKDSQWVLGQWYDGAVSGITPDYAKAIKWLTLAAENGYWQACNMLAYYYAQGKGTEKNYQRAHTLISDARFRAEQSGELSKDIEANLLDSDGEIYLMEEKKDLAYTIWGKMKNNYPEFVEKNKYEINNVFVRTMYTKEENEKKLSHSSESPQKQVIISDIDENIPENAIAVNPVFAVIIANENYKDVENVPFAIHDGETFKQYCEKTLGIPKSNIKFVADATFNNIKRELNWANQVMDVYNGEASIIFYYAGHGIPNESDGSAYILPVDGIGNDVSTGYSLDKLYNDLSCKPAKSVIVLLDACFSGARRDGGMIASARGVAIKAKHNAPKGNMIILSAAQGDETAYPHKEKGHGMFTYFLLKKIQETKGNASFGELADYVTSEVKKQSIIINGKMQTPLASPSSNATDWRNWKFR